MSSNQVFSVAVCGGSASGKTTFVHRLKEELGEDHLTCISQDDYYSDLSHMTMEERDAVNFDHPDSLDHELLTEQLFALAKGHPIQKPCYDFKTHCRKKETVLVKPKSILIFEGIFSMSYPKLNDLFDLKIFVDVPADIRFVRKLQRDLGSRGRELSHIIEQYMKMVRVMHKKIVEPCKAYADFIVPWIHPDEKIVKALCHQIIKTKNTN